MYVIAFSGRMQSGKSTAANFIKGYFEDDSMYPSVKIYNFADKLKMYCHELYNIPLHLLYGSNEDKNTLTNIYRSKFDILLNRELTEGYATVRQVLQDMASILRSIDDECFVNACKNQIKKDNPYIALIGDMRFNNEFHAMKEIDNFYNIKFTRNIINSDHTSETCVDELDYDFLIRNDNIDQREKNKIILKIIITASTIVTIK